MEYVMEERKKDEKKKKEKQMKGDYTCIAVHKLWEVTFQHLCDEGHLKPPVLSLK